MNDVQAAMDAFSKDDEVAQVSPLFPTAEKELLEDLRDQYLAANAKLKGKNTLRQKGEGEHDVVRRLIDDYYHKNLANPPVAVIRTLIIEEAHFLRNAVSFWGIGAALAGNGAERTIMCTGTPFNNGPRDMAALQSYVDASSPAAEEKWWKAVWKSKFYGAFVLNHRVILHAIDATPPRWRGDAGSSPLDRARTAASSPQKDLVKSCTRLTG